LDYTDTAKLLSCHCAHIITFLSKDVTHIIKTTKAPIINGKVVNKMRYSRAERIVRLSLKSKSANRKECTSVKPVEMSFASITKLSKECTFSHYKIRQNSTVDSANDITNAKVRTLQGQFIKVEDGTGIYRPLIMEMEEWPRIYFNSDSSLSPFCNPNVKVRQLTTGNRTKKRLCELCNMYYNDVQHHVHGSQHQANARNDKLFAGIDAMIAEGPFNL
jgi:hypothetical protein